ncbi:MAG TPA: helix-turn-helix domain-containing GNAT family N-acetyltransferase [Solirubrobacterales bacterium]|nr:helix-turn-helix domain-containing GNAT family N-acetyltransferase [Solirubrobacterales bacterium]
MPVVPDDAVAEVREFNRFYTRVIGVLDDGLLGSTFSLTEARVLYDLNRAERTETSELRELLGLDRGYLSRILARFERAGLIRRERSARDRRRQVVRLSAKGRRALDDLERRSDAQATELLDSLGDPEKARLLGGMTAIRGVLDAPAGEAARSFDLRAPREGELGWIVSRHGILYSRSYGWDDSFEALVAEIVATFAKGQADLERAWIADVAGAPAGSVLCTRKDESTAQLRLLLVEPWARGLGVGTALVDACVRFARESGYRRLTLWTNDVLVGARRIYEGAGFELIAESAHRSFGKQLTGQDWELELS